MKSAAAPVHQISLRLREIGQLFNSMDPTPFRHRDLDPNAEEFIESWAQEFPSGSRFLLVIHLQHKPAEGDPALLTEAIHNFYGDKAQMAQHDLKRLLRLGRTSLLVGLGFLTLCTLGAKALGALGEGPYVEILREGLVIAGWVAMWRPIQIFLYEWWPITHRRRMLHNLSRAQVRVVEGQ
ncbi:MAG TPA: hypothetical protein VKA16_11800 [Burkholderiales bacterium]|nr:hypothetical protein [Burkholderiales bacterium]